jgi:hypothetical protein
MKTSPSTNSRIVRRLAAEWADVPGVRGILDEAMALLSWQPPAWTSEEFYRLIAHATARYARIRSTRRLSFDEALGLGCEQLKQFAVLEELHLAFVRADEACVEETICRLRDAALLAARSDHSRYLLARRCLTWTERTALAAEWLDFHKVREKQPWELVDVVDALVSAIEAQNAIRRRLQR